MAGLIEPLRVTPGSTVKLSRDRDPGCTGPVSRVSRRKQAERFLKRIDRPDKNWKFSLADVRERRHWAEYRRAYDAMLSRTSTRWAPWYVVSADHKWFSRLATAAVLVRALHAIGPRYPAADPAVCDQMMQARAELAAELGIEQPASERPQATPPH